MGAELQVKTWNHKDAKNTKVHKEPGKPEKKTSTAEDAKGAEEMHTLRAGEKALRRQLEIAELERDTPSRA